MFLPIFAALSKRKVRYLVIGGVAVNLHGYSRTTGDLDLLLDLSPSNLQKFLAAIEDLGLKPTAPIQAKDLADPVKRKAWIKNKNLKAVSFYDPKNPMLSLDILIDFKIDFDQVYKQKDSKALEKGTLPLISLENLMRMKKATGRLRDAADIRALKTLKELNNEKAVQKKSKNP